MFTNFLWLRDWQILFTVRLFFIPKYISNHSCFVLCIWFWYSLMVTLYSRRSLLENLINSTDDCFNVSSFFFLSFPLFLHSILIYTVQSIESKIYWILIDYSDNKNELKRREHSLFFWFEASICRAHSLVISFSRVFALTKKQYAFTFNCKKAVDAVTRFLLSYNGRLVNF